MASSGRPTSPADPAVWFQFLRLAQTLRHYGYLRFDACVADFPEKDCPVVVSAGNSELSLQLRLPGQQLREGSFRVTRMRCWRVTSSVSWGRACSEGRGSGQIGEVTPDALPPLPPISTTRCHCPVEAQAAQAGAGARFAWNWLSNTS